MLLSDILFPQVLAGAAWLGATPTLLTGIVFRFLS
jgi:hypothetical protein